MNLLHNWITNLKTNSSSLNPGQTISIKGAIPFDKISGDFRRWFGNTNFEVLPKELVDINPGEMSNQNWLHSILAGQNMKSVQTVTELWQVLKFHEREDAGRIEHLVNYLNKRRYRQFRDYYFELFTFYVFERNGVQNTFKVYEGNKELEGEIEVGGEKILIECRKLYFHKYSALEMNVMIMEKFIKYLTKKPAEVILTFKYNRVDKSLVDQIIKDMDRQIQRWNNDSGPFIIMPYVKHFNDDAELNLEIYSDENRFEDIVKSIDLENYITIQMNGVRLTDGSGRSLMKMRMSNRVSSTDTESYDRFFKSIKSKRKNRSDSKYKHRVYLFESEHYPGFDRGLFILDTFSEKIQEKIQGYLDGKSTSDTVVLLLKESNTVDFPRIRKVVMSNKKGDPVRAIIENMEFDFE